jgi:hypothetical protein
MAKFEPRFGIGMVALSLALTVGAVAPASAEFFGCNDKPGRVLYSYGGTPAAYGPRYTRSRARYTHEFAAQSRARQTHVTYNGATRYRHEGSRW